MCGFAGLITTRTDLDVRAALSKMLRALRHRGPDGSIAGEIRLTSGWQVGLAHARLAILDPTDAGLQPMATPDREIWTIFNGEIYNHQSVREKLSNREWRTGTDTETILHAWHERGAKSLAELRGMFGMALVNTREQRLWLVRDRLGIKPVYVASAGESLWLFASELRSIIASGLVSREICCDSMEEYLAFGAVAPPNTMIRGIHRLQPGEYWEFDLRTARPTVQKQQYWSVDFVRQNSAESRKPVDLGPLKAAFEEAATSHLLSDVPIGIFLSGGVDSAAIVEAVTRRHSRIETYSVAFDEEEFDESAMAELTARKFGTVHQKLVLTQQEMLRELPRAFDSYDTPSFDGINTWFISKIVREAGVKVALSGLGGDELFAGYGYHRLMKQLASGAFRTAAQVGARILKAVGGGIRVEKLLLASSTNDRWTQYLAMRRVLSPNLVSRLLPGRTAGQPSLPLAEEMRSVIRGLDPVNTFSLLDMRFYMQNTLLRDTDQMSMAHALEARVPFLDHRVVEEAARLPGDLKLAPANGMRTKGLIGSLLDRPLPAEIISRKKSGFVFPWEKWLREDLRDFVAEGLVSQRAVNAAGLEMSAIQDLHQRFQRRDSSVRSTDVLCLLVLLHWIERVVVGDPASLAPASDVVWRGDLMNLPNANDVL